VIFVTVGTNEARFDRLLRGVDAAGIDEELVVQYGSSDVRPQGAHCVESVPFDELLDLARRADAVIAHAGVGSIVALLTIGKRPIVVPRLHRFGEAVDDHQLDFGRKLHEAGLVELVEDESRLDDAIGRARDSRAVELSTDGALAAELRDYVAGYSR
jgi:UDP-N-acetylglucosamine transferase subunit ALG13